MYRKTILPNGLRIVTNNMKQRDSVSIGLWIDVGGRYEEDSLKGIAHFMEHIVFKGSQKYSCAKIKELIEGVGGSFNAFTSEEQTCFYAKTPYMYMDQTFDVLADMAFFPNIASGDVSKEKTVIVEEIKMYRDLPQYRVLEIFDGMLWPNHPLGKSLTGSIDTVMSLSKNDLQKFHKRYYIPKNIVIAVCGQLNHQKVVNLVNKKLGKVKGKGENDYLRVQKYASQPQSKFFKKNTEQMHLTLGMPGLDEKHKDRHALSILSIILGGNMSSRLFVELREKRGWVYSVSSGSKLLHDTGVFMIRAGVDNQKTVTAVELILKELNKVKRYGINQKEFIYAKDYLLGQLLLGLEDTMEHMLWVGESVIAKDKIKTLKSVIKEFAKIGKEDINRVAKEIIKDDYFNLAMVGPLTGQQEKALNHLMGIK